RVQSRNSTVFNHLDASAVTPAIVSPAMRRLLRPRGRLMRLLQFEGDVQPDNLIARAGEGELSPAETKQSLPGIITVNQVSETLGVKKAPQALKDLLPRYPWLKYAPLALACLIPPPLLFFGAPGLVAGAIIAAALVYAYKWLDRLAYEVKRSSSISEENQTAGSVYDLPLSPDFVIAEPDSSFTPTQGEADSPESERVKYGLLHAYTLIEASANSHES